MVLRCVSAVMQRYNGMVDIMVWWCKTHISFSVVLEHMSVHIDIYRVHSSLTPMVMTQDVCPPRYKPEDQTAASTHSPYT